MVRHSKFLKFENIPIKKLVVGKGNVRTENVTESISDLAEHIYVNDLLEPIVVYSVDDIKSDSDLYESRKQFKGKFEILAGQRRYTAFLHLDKQYPGEGFDKIPCHVRLPPEDELDAKAISIGENLTQLPMTLADAIDACETLFRKYNDERTVARKYGVSVALVKKYVKFARLPKILQDNLAAFDKNPKTAMNIALEAVDALDYVKDGEVPEKKVYDFAKMLGEKKKKSNEEYTKLKQAAEKNPKKSLAEIEKASVKIKNPKRFNILLDADNSDDLEELAESIGVTPEEEGRDLIIDGLRTKKSREEHTDEEN